MGLDMSLYKKTRLPYHWDTDKGKWVHSKVSYVDDYGKHHNCTGKPDSLTFDVGYWRKANQIHNWFVENVQDGEDDCKSYYVDPDKLRELLNICKHILKLKRWKAYARKNLPTCAGFFFGGTEYDEYYLSDIKSTVEIIEKVFADFDERSDSLYYESSW